MKKEVTDLEDLDMSGVLWRIIAFSSGGPFLEGYVLGIIGVALSRLGTDIEISNSMSGLLGIAALVGLFLGAAVGGWLTDLIGRHKMFILDLIVIVVLSALCAVVTSPLQLVALRFLIGVAIGADYPIATSRNVDGHDRCCMVSRCQCRSSCGLRALRNPSRLALDAGVVCDPGSTNSYRTLGYPRISQVVGIERPPRRSRSRCHEAFR